MPQPTDRRQAGAGYLYRWIEQGKIVTLIDAASTLMHDQWRLAATKFGVTVSPYWLFVWPQGGEAVSAGNWTINLPAGAPPPPWHGNGYATFDLAYAAYMTARQTNCGKPSKPHQPGKIGDDED